MPGQELPKSALETLDLPAKRQMLLDLAKVDESTLGMLGCTPENETVFVADTGDNLFIGNELNALMLYARANAIELGDPQCVEPGAIGGEVWEVRMFAYDTDAGPLATGDSEAAVRAALRSSLWDLCGTRVAPLSEWARDQDSGDFMEEMAQALAVPKALDKPKAPPFVNTRWIKLKTLPLAAVGAHITDQTGVAKVRRKAALAMLAAPSGMSTSGGDGSLPSAWSVRTFEDEGTIYANHHDLQSALHMGLDIENIQPWPCDVAHKFLIQEELRRAMRGRGFVQIEDFDPKKWVKLRASLPEFTPSVTGDPEPEKVKTKKQEKPHWPPTVGDSIRVVIILDRARLAYEEEAEWENVALRSALQSTGMLWVEREGPYERKRKTKVAAKKSLKATTKATVTVTRKPLAEEVDA